MSSVANLATRGRSVLLLLACAVAHAAVAAELSAVASRPPPAAAGTRLDAMLAAFADRPLIINFWASWCEPCREEMPALQQLASRWREQHLAVLTVAVADQQKRIDAFLGAHAIELPVIDDREQQLSRAWGVRLLPTTLVLDRRHRIRLRAEGAIDWESAAVGERLQAVFERPPRCSRAATESSDRRRLASRNRRCPAPAAASPGGYRRVPAKPAFRLAHTFPAAVAAVAAHHRGRFSADPPRS